MIENNQLQENLIKTEKNSAGLSTRPPLQSLYHENVAVPLQLTNSNPQLVKIYFNEIFNFLESTEENFQIKSDYFLLHTEINHTSRAFLIDWLVTLHSKFRLLQETLYISVNLVDRYLSRRMVTKKQLQLVGVTAMFIAAKYEEIYPPNARDFLLATEQAYTKQHLIKMEVDMLKVMNFQVTFPTAWRFMEKYPEVNSGGNNLLAEYLLELGQVEFIIVKHKPSVQAASVIYLASLLMGKNQNWKVDDLQGSQMQDCVKDFLKVFKSAASHPLTSVRDKYQKKKLDIVKIEQESL